MTLSTVITSTFLTGIHQQKSLLKTTINNQAEAASVIVGYIQFLQANSQYTAASDLSEYTNITTASTQSVIDVLKSIYKIEAQEVARIVQNNPSLQYEAGSMLYQAAYNLALVAQNINSTYAPSALDMADAYNVQEAMEATEGTYTFIKTFVKNYQLTSQIDAYYLQLTNLGDANLATGMGETTTTTPAGSSTPVTTSSTNAITILGKVKTALQNFLVSLQQNLSTLQALANSNTGNPVSTANVSGFSPSTSGAASNDITMWWIVGGVAILAVIYFMMSSKSSVVVMR